MNLIHKILILLFGVAISVKAVPPVLNYTGQVAVNGEAFDGNGLFKFALVNANGNASYWSNDGTSANGSEPATHVSISVNGGLYSLLLGNTAMAGMGAIDPAVFAQHTDAKLRVWFNDGVNGFQQLSPDRPFASVPYAFSAGTAQSATIADGSINKSMLGSDVIADLNETITITRDMLPQDVRDDLNKTITITRNMLPPDVLSDLNRTIAKSMLSSSILADLNRSISKNNLGNDVLSDLNSSISLNRLSPEVLAALQVTPSISTKPFARYDWRTDSATIEARGRGHNLSYQWLKNDQVIAGATAPVLEITDVNLTDGANYSLLLTNSVGQVVSQSVTLEQAIGAPGLPLEEANATEVPRNGLILWMDANDLNADGKADHLPDDQFVDYWKSKIGDVNATQSDSSQKANIKKLPHNNLTCLSFDGNDFMLDNNVSLPTRCVFIVYETRGTTKNRNILGNISIGYNSNHHFDGGDFVNGSEGRFRGNGKNGIQESYNKLGIVFLTRGNDAPYQGLFSSLQLSLNSWEGDLAEILFYNRVLSNTERNSVERYLADKWGVSFLEDLSPPTEPENGLLAYYKFEPVNLELEKLWDYSGNDYHGSLQNFVGDPWADGIDGSSLQFDGMNDQVNLPSIQGEIKTITFWMNADFTIDGTGEESRIWFVGGQDGVWANNGQHFRMRVNYSHGRTLPEANLGTLTGWNHIALPFDNKYFFYVNGEIVDGTGSANLFNNPTPTLGSSTYKGRLDEFRFYNKALTALEIQLLYAAANDEPILRTTGELNAIVGTSFSLSLAADNGPTTYLAEGLPAGLSLNTTTGQITGSLSQPGYHRVFVKAMNEHGTGSDTIAIVARPQTDQYGWPVDVPDGSAIPQNGLVLWLDANDVDADGEFDSGTEHLKLSNWADKAGKDHNATQETVANQPEIRTGQISGKPNLNVLVFDGNQSLSFPTIAQGRTFFWVLQRHAQGNRSAHYFGQKDLTLWYQNTQSGAYRISTNNAQVGSQIKNGIWRNNGIVNDMNFYDDSRVLSLTATGMTSSDLIGRRGNANEYYIGNISEILVYDRVLSTTEIETVEKYLGQKWGVSISHDTTPSPTGNPPTYTVTPANDSVTTAHLTEQILKYLKPEITAHPQTQNVYAHSSASFSVTAEGKYLTYQWKKDGSNLTGKTNSTLTITDANTTLHDGNYSVVVSNDFGSVESGVVEVLISDSLLNGLVGWWKFDESNGTVAYDSSGNGNNGNLTGGPTWTNGKIGGALSFDGVDDYVKVMHSDELNLVNSFSIALWVKISRKTASGDYTSDQNLISKRLNLVNYSEAYALKVFGPDRPDDGRAEFGTNASTFSPPWHAGSSIVDTNEWYYLTVTIDNQSVEIFINSSTDSESSYTGQLSVNEQPIFIGIKADMTRAVKGLIDDLRIYDRALSAEEVLALYNLGQ